MIECRTPITFEGKIWKCSRLSYSLNVCEIPRTPVTLVEGIVCHNCDNPWCINPDHLYLGTMKQNNDDKWARNEFVRKRISEAQKGNSFARGMKHTDEWKKRQSAMMKGNKFRNKGAKK